jgi:hypothetical protein
MNRTVESLIHDCSQLTEATDPGGAKQRQLALDLAFVLHPTVVHYYMMALSENACSLLARVQILKNLGIHRVSDTEQYRALGLVVLDKLAHFEDEMERNYAILAAAAFPDIPGMFDAVKDLVLGSDEDDTVRSNAFTYFRKAEPTEAHREVLRQLLQDDLLSFEAEKLLKKWG